VESLTFPQPADPIPLASEWLDAAASQPGRNRWAMALATAAPRPAVRYVLLKHIDAAGGFIVFYTNYGSRKAGELESAGRAAAALYWADLGRQLRFEGTVERSPPHESDAYFATRPRASQLNAWASRQSQALQADSDLDGRVERYSRQFAGQQAIPRPEFWGGYRLRLDAVEFWLEGADRFHERVRYLREPGTGNAKWRHDRLQP
jgi:pyridoxamine 5'-phosphate oxidase